MPLILTGAWASVAWALDRHGRRCQLVRDDYHAIVVLGARVEHGGRPSTTLATRVAHGIELYRAGWASRLLFCGGGNPAEAEVAAALARQAGVSDLALICEARSRSTRENARFSAELLGAVPVIVVTDTYHAFRAGRLFRSHFPGVAISCCRSPWAARCRGALREVAALGLHWLIDR
ncbi:MAG: YdcF family protein [Deltaproteobacteria bacterium]|nr:YdcF family protein [Deltaproteobacteria bacterium]